MVPGNSPLYCVRKCVYSHAIWFAPHMLHKCALPLEESYAQTDTNVCVGHKQLIQSALLTFTHTHSDTPEKETPSPFIGSCIVCDGERGREKCVLTCTSSLTAYCCSRGWLPLTPLVTPETRSPMTSRIAKVKVHSICCRPPSGLALAWVNPSRLH